MKKLLSVVTATAFSLGMMAPFATPAHAKAAFPSLQEVLEAAEKDGFCYTYTGRDQVFDGTRIVSGTAQDMERLKNSNKGTLLIRYKTTSDTNQVMIAAGNSDKKDEYGAVLLNGASSVDKVRVDFPDGMSANLSNTVVSDGEWHTFIYSVDASDASNKSQKTVTSFDGSTETQYPDYASWYNSNPDVNNLEYLTIGGADGTLSNSEDHNNFIGELAFTAFVPETFTQEEAAALSAEPWSEQEEEIAQENELVYQGKDIVIRSEGDAVALNKSVLDRLSRLKDATVVVSYTNTNSDIGSLLSVSDSTKTNAHFHLYQQGSTLGFEFRNNDQPKYAATTSVYDGERNTVAFVADSTSGYKLFANGVLGASLEKKGDAYQFLDQLAGLDKAYLGKTDRVNDPNSYPFQGTIHSIEVYDHALADRELIERTSVTQKQRTKAFVNGDATGSKFFRIPFLLHTVDGSLIAGCDANFGSTGDSAENIDAAIRRKANAAKYGEDEGWSDAVVPYALHMQDYADETGYKQFSSSVIDGVIVQDQKSPTNRILLVIDAFAWNGGVFQQLNIDGAGEAHGGTARSIAYGDGFCTIDGKKYLLLSSKNIKDKGINMNTDRSQFDYAVDIYGETNSEGRYNIYKLNGTPKPYSNNGTNVDDSNLSLGELSAYSLSTEYELYKDGQLMEVQQRTKDSSAQPVQVPAKIFYEDCKLQMYNTSYLLQVYSDDDGATWHSGNIISGMVKRENSRYYITGPGSGLQIKNGAHAGRILIPIYYQGKSSTEVIYTDDGGKTWKHGEPIPSNLALHESAIVEMPDGSLQIFVRNTTGSGGKLITARSYDGGETWTEGDSLFGDNGPGTNCQISAINYSKDVTSTKDGKSYPAVLLATTSSGRRTNGHIYVGLIKPNNDSYSIDWEYDYTLTGRDEPFAYSCMAELANGKIGILYETSENKSWSTGLQQMYYKELTIEELTAHPFQK